MVPADSVLSLIREFQQADFFALDTAFVPHSRGCGVAATDMPSALLVLHVQNRVKRVRHYYGCTGSDSLASIDSLLEWTEHPRGVLGILFALANRVEAIAQTSHWVKIAR